MKTALWSAGLAVVFAGVLALAEARSAPPSEPMPPSWRVWLEANRPRGHWVGDNYHFCDQRGGGYWVVFKANGDWVPTAKACWIHLIPWTLDD